MLNFINKNILIFKNRQKDILSEKLTVQKKITATLPDS